MAVGGQEDGNGALQQVGVSNLDAIIECVENEFSIDLTIRSRKTLYTNARYIYYRLAIKLTNKSLTRIANKIGYDHATAVYYRDKFIPDERFNDSYFNILEAFNNESKNLKEEEAGEKLRDVEKLNEMLLERVQSLQARINYLLTTNSDTPEEKLKKIYRELDSKNQKDLLFKAKTILKVQQKLNAA